MNRARFESKHALPFRFARDSRGATLTEFGFVAPVLILLLMGLFDMAHSQYTSAMVNGAMQKAARDLTLENAVANQATIDGRVRTEVLKVTPSTATVTFEKLSHFDFSDVGEAEPVIENNTATRNGRCDPGETYVDTNDNGRWDTNRGQTGIGGARDVVLYTATVSYPRLFPMYGLAGMSQNVTLQASTVLRNQPFDEQNRSTTVGNCP